MTLGERLLEYRTNAKMSQDVLAEKVGVTRQTISKWETNQSTPEFNKILPLCEVFEITTDELITGEKKNELENKENDNSYLEKMNKQKAIVISSSVFLYLIGMFSLPYMVETLQYSDTHAIMITTTLWSIASVILIYFFISHPKEKEREKKKEGNQVKNNISDKLETTVFAIIALLFLVGYFLISFITMAWYITWILWIVFLIVIIIARLIFAIKKGDKDE